MMAFTLGLKAEHAYTCPFSTLLVDFFCSLHVKPLNLTGTSSKDWLGNEILSSMLLASATMGSRKQNEVDVTLSKDCRKDAIYLNGLTTMCESICQFVKEHRDAVSEALFYDGRSRLGRLVKQLPNIDDGNNTPITIQELAMASLPDSSDALVLAAASAAVYHLSATAYERAFYAADVALILVGVHDAFGAELLRFIQALQEKKMIAVDESVKTRAVIDESKLVTSFKLNVPTPLSDVECADVRADELSTEQFTEDFFRTDVPVVLRDIATRWPAFEKWHDLGNLSAEHGHRVVPVERVRRSAIHSGKMREEFQTLKEVFQAMEQDASNVDVNEKASTTQNRTKEQADDEESVYLAQHPLFDYIPELQNDVRIPRFVEAGGKGANVDVINLWMGTSGSGSKLHFDSADNILVQVVGRKTVILIDPQYSSSLDVSPAVPNISPIHPLKSEPEHPNFLKTVRGCTIQLNAGDGLFIPAKHWHWVQADTCSMSVNFWF